MANLYLVSGLSGSGKSTFAKRLQNKLNIPIIDTDYFYEVVNGDELDRSHKFEVWIKFFEAIHECEINGISCIVDTAALTVHDKDQFQLWFPGFDNYYLIMITADKQLRYKNNDSRKRKVPIAALESQERRVQYFSLLSWTEVIHLININNEGFYTLEGEEYFTKEKR